MTKDKDGVYVVYAIIAVVYVTTVGPWLSESLLSKPSVIQMLAISNFKSQKPI